MSKSHLVKCWPESFRAVRSGEKKAEFRNNDRGYLVGDVLVLQEWCPNTNCYTGEICPCKITHVLTGPETTVFGVPDGYAMLSLELPTPELIWPSFPNCPSCKGKGFADCGCGICGSVSPMVMGRPFSIRHSEVVNAHTIAHAGTLDQGTSGLWPKYEVRRTDGRDRPGQKHCGCELFVLDLTHDTHARTAARAYVEACREEKPALARDLQSIVGIVEFPRNKAAVPADPHGLAVKAAAFKFAAHDLHVGLHAVAHGLQRNVARINLLQVIAGVLDRVDERLEEQGMEL